MAQPGNLCLYFNGMSKTKCLVWGLDRCLMCEQGFYPSSTVDVHTGDNICNSCVKSEVEDMTIYGFDSGTKKHSVMVCENGVPNETNSGCIKFDELDSEVKKNPSLDNCVWGGRDLNGSTGCYKCLEGFISKFGDSYTYAGRCVSQQELETDKIKFKGCLRVGNFEGYDVGRCMLCDFDKGYSMNNYHGDCVFME